MSRQSKVFLTRLIVIVVPVGLYELLCRLGVLDPFSWVPFSTTVEEWFHLIIDVDFLVHTVAPTLRTILLSAALAALTGLAAGIALWRFPFAYRIANPYLTLYYSVPAFAFYPILLSLLGSGPQSLILLSSLLGFAAMTANVVIGLNATQTIQTKLGRVLGLNFARMLWRINFPAAVPQLVVGLRLTIAFAIIGVVGGEFLSGTQGLGYFVNFSYNSFALAETYAGVLIIIMISLLLNWLLSLVAGLLYPMETIGK